MNIETLDSCTLTEPDARAIAELLCAVWPKPGRTVETRTAQLLGQWRDYSGPEEQHPRSFIIRESGRVIAHSGIFPRTIGTQDGEITILALARVCTDPAQRGRHLGEAVVRESFKPVDDGTFPWSLYQTNHKVRPFYERFGAVPDPQPHRQFAGRRPDRLSVLGRNRHALSRPPRLAGRRDRPPRTGLLATEVSENTEYFLGKSERFFHLPLTPDS